MYDRITRVVHSRSYNNTNLETCIIGLHVACSGSCDNTNFETCIIEYVCSALCIM